MGSELELKLATFRFGPRRATGLPIARRSHTNQCTFLVLGDRATLRRAIADRQPAEKRTHPKTALLLTKIGMIASILRESEGEIQPILSECFLT